MSRPMQDKDGDLAFFLYTIPFVVNFAYTLYLWAGNGITSALPQLIFLEVTQNPYIFLIGFAAVLFAAVLDFNAAAPDRKRSALVGLSKRLQAIAFVSIILAMAAAWYAAGWNFSSAGFNLLDGRYPLVFPALLVFFSFLILPAVKLQGANLRNALITLLLIASPVALYEIGKRDTVAGLGVGLILLTLAALLLVRNKRE